MKNMESFLLMLKEEERSENTILKYERDVKNFLNFLNGHEITKKKYSSSKIISRGFTRYVV